MAQAARMIIPRYILIKLIGATALITFGFWVFFTIIHFAQEAEAIGKHDYHAPLAFMYALLKSSTTLSSILPIIGLFSFLMVYGALASSHELIALQALGTSYQRLTATAFMVCMSTFLLLLTAIELGGPPIERFAEQLKAHSLKQAVSSNGRDIWIKDQHRFIFIGKLNSPNEAENIRLYEMDEQLRFQSITQAPRAQRQGNQPWQLFHPTQVKFRYGETPKDTQIMRQSFDSLILDSLITSEQSQRLDRSPRQMNLLQLMQTMKELTHNGLSNDRYALNFWVRVLAPVSLLGFILLTLPLFLGSTRHTSASERVFIGLMFAMPYFLLQHLSQQATLAYGLNAEWMAFSMPCLLLTLGIGRYFWSIRV